MKFLFLENFTYDSQLFSLWCVDHFWGQNIMHGIHSSRYFSKSIFNQIFTFGFHRYLELIRVWVMEGRILFLRSSKWYRRVRQVRILLLKLLRWHQRWLASWQHKRRRGFIGKYRCLRSPLQFYFGTLWCWLQHKRPFRFYSKAGWL